VAGLTGVQGATGVTKDEGGKLIKCPMYHAEEWTFVIIWIFRLHASL
jgi:hypothetical protein